MGNRTVKGSVTQNTLHA